MKHQLVICPHGTGSPWRISRHWKQRPSPKKFSSRSLIVKYLTRILFSVGSCCAGVFFFSFESSHHVKDVGPTLLGLCGRSVHPSSPCLERQRSRCLGQTVGGKQETGGPSVLGRTLGPGEGLPRQALWARMVGASAGVTSTAPGRRAVREVKAVGAAVPFLGLRPEVLRKVPVRACPGSQPCHSQSAGRSGHVPITQLREIKGKQTVVHPHGGRSFSPKRTS